MQGYVNLASIAAGEGDIVRKTDTCVKIALGHLHEKQIDFDVGVCVVLGEYGSTVASVTVVCCLGTSNITASIFQVQTLSGQPPAMTAPRV